MYLIHLIMIYYLDNTMFFHVILDISLFFFNQMILIFQAYFSAFELTPKKYTESGTIIQSDVFTGNPWMIFSYLSESEL